MRLLIVEDDRLLGDGLSGGLRAMGFSVDWLGDGAQADAALAGTAFDLIVLDLGLPGRDGLEWLKRWRLRAERVPVLILTARGELEQRIAGLDAGADDYLVKPVQIAELAARVRALLRRSHSKPEPVWTHGDLRYDTESRRVFWQGRHVELAPRETALLEVLLASPQRVLSRATLQDKLYAFEQDIDSNALEVHVHHLRRKLHAKVVRTVRGVGYALGAPVTRDREEEGP
jgi:two-component system, OmpR family, response regulator QseB